MIVPPSVPVRMLRLGLLACVAAIALLPLCREVQPLDPPAPLKPPHQESKAPMRILPVAVRALVRDPFARASDQKTVPTAVPVGDGRARPFTVVAVASGAAAHALVSQDGATRLVSAGDFLNGIRIASVGPAGLRLDDGRYFGLGIRQ